MTLGLTELNRCNGNNFLDNMRAIKGPNVAIGTLLNLILAKVNQDALSTAGAATVTIAGTPHTGDIITTTLNGVALVQTSLTLGVVATGTVTIAGTAQTGDVINCVIDGIMVEIVVATATVTAAAVLLKNAINANVSLGARFLATNSAGVVTITALATGVAGNVTLTTLASGAGATTTSTASGAALTGGVTGDSVTTLATALKNAINAHASLSPLFTATSAVGVVTITANEKGTGGNAYTLTTAVTGGGATVTSAASAATLTGGTGLDDIAIITD